MMKHIKRILKDRGNRKITLTEELRLIGATNDDSILTETDKEKIIIRKVV